MCLVTSSLDTLRWHSELLTVFDADYMLTVLDDGDYVLTSRPSGPETLNTTISGLPCG